MTKSVLVTGSHGFIGRNLVTRLREQGHIVHEVIRKTTSDELRQYARSSDVAVHLAGSNRPANSDEYDLVNVGFTEEFLSVLEEVNPIPVVFASSTQAALDNPYGASKRSAEQLIGDYGLRCAQRTSVVRLPNVFGKWSRPNYNSVVATFVHNASRGLPLDVQDATRVIELSYIDDVVDLLGGVVDGSVFVDNPRPSTVYRMSVGQLAATVRAIHDARSRNQVLEVGTDFMRALYATYVSFLQPVDFCYPLAPKVDARGAFTEVLRTPASGQVSYLTAVSGATRGSHYHHTKIEKFVVVAGRARFRFRCLVENTIHEIHTDAATPVVVESIPGWVHDITNVGECELVVLVWANEVFDPARPDTLAQEV